jgi:TolB-like protein/Flp pilus assembly protein TadD
LRTRVLQGLLVVAFGVALGWLVVDPSPEPVVAALTALVALLSLSSLPRPRAAGANQVDREREGRVAVLPLRNIAEAPGREYFAAGLTEELISVLSRVRALEVIASPSSSQYQDQSPPISQIGRELNVGAVLQGSVRSVGDELRVSIRLVDAATKRLLWSEDYDQQLEKVFAVQRDIAVSVARALEVTIHGSEAARLGEAPTSDLKAYDLYLLARHDLNGRTEEGLQRSIERFRAALAKDPSFAAAEAGLADAYVLATIGYASIPRDVAVKEAREAADRALKANPALADAYTSQGWVLMNFDWDWAGAQAAFQRALELNPSDARAYQWLAQCYSYQGRPEDAVAVAQRAQEFDPRSALIATEAGWPYLYLGRWDEAEAQFKRALELDPDFALAHYNLGNVLEARGDLEGALDKYEKAASLSNHAPMFVAFAARVQGLLGRDAEARRSLQGVIEAVDAGAPLSVYVAHAFEGMGETEQALKWLDRTITNGDMLTIAIGTAWMPFERLRGDVRYEAMRQRIPQGTLARPFAG